MMDAMAQQLRDGRTLAQLSAMVLGGEFSQTCKNSPPSATDGGRAAACWIRVDPY
jgi:hypothetical protein